MGESQFTARFFLIKIFRVVRGLSADNKTCGKVGKNMFEFTSEKFAIHNVIAAVRPVRKVGFVRRRARWCCKSNGVFGTSFVGSSAHTVKETFAVIFALTMPNFGSLQNTICDIIC